MNKIALYTSCDSNYINETIISFKSFTNKNINTFDCFLIGNSFSNKDIEKLKEHNITYINEDLYDEYKIELNWPYPSECFWIYKGPVIFYEMGYEYSLSIDSDVYCNKKLDLTWLFNINIIAGSTKINNRTAHNFLSGLDNINIIKNVFNDFNFNENSIDLSAGVLFYNNKNYVDNNIYELSLNLFKRSKLNNISRKGDDSLMSLMVFLSDPSFFYYLDNHWNNYNLNDNFKESYILHGSPIKPWVKGKTEFSKYLNEQWNKINF